MKFCETDKNICTFLVNQSMPSNYNNKPTTTSAPNMAALDSMFTSQLSTISSNNPPNRPVAMGNNTSNFVSSPQTMSQQNQQNQFSNLGGMRTNQGGMRPNQMGTGSNYGMGSSQGGMATNQGMMRPNQGGMGTNFGGGLGNNQGLIGMNQGLGTYQGGMGTNYGGIGTNMNNTTTQQQRNPGMLQPINSGILQPMNNQTSSGNHFNTKDLDDLLMWSFCLLEMLFKFSGYLKATSFRGNKFSRFVFLRNNYFSW